MKTSYYKKDHEKVCFWVHLLMRANWEPTKEYLGGKLIVCQPGQFTTGRQQLADELGMNSSKVERLLTFFEKTEQQIEQRKTNTNRLITIVNWSEYQSIEQRNGQQVNNDRTTDEQRMNTLKEYKEDKEDQEEKNARTREREEMEKLDEEMMEKFRMQLLAGEV